MTPPIDPTTVDPPSIRHYWQLTVGVAACSEISFADPVLVTSLCGSQLKFGPRIHVPPTAPGPTMTDSSQQMMQNGMDLSSHPVPLLAHTEL